MVFNLKKSTAWAFAVPLGYMSTKTWQKIVCYAKLIPLIREKKFKSRPQNRILYILEILLKISDERPRPSVGVPLRFPVAILLTIRLVTACCFGPYLAPRAPSNDMVVKYNCVLCCCFTCRHNDIPWQLRKNYMNRMENVTLDKNNPDFHTDIPRLKEGGVGAQVKYWNLNSAVAKLPACRTCEGKSALTLASRSPCFRFCSP